MKVAGVVVVVASVPLTAALRACVSLGRRSNGRVSASELDERAIAALTKRLYDEVAR